MMDKGCLEKYNAWMASEMRYQQGQITLLIANHLRGMYGMNLHSLDRKSLEQRHVLYDCILAINHVYFTFLL